MLVNYVNKKHYLNLLLPYEQQIVDGFRMCYIFYPAFKFGTILQKLDMMNL
jgi:hypothetical protein